MFARTFFGGGDVQTRNRVRFYRARAAAWTALGAVSFPLGWAESVALVWVASIYANVVSDLGAAEAADNRELIDRLDRIENATSRPPRRPRARTTLTGRAAATRRLRRP